MKSRLKSNPASLTRLLAWITFSLAAINILIQFAIYSFGLNKEWFLLFNMDKEVNIPTIFSCSLMLICASLIWLITRKSKNKDDAIQRKWNVLRWTFIFLMLDEGLQIHEAFTIPSIKPMLPPILSVVWVIPYGIFAIFAIVYFMPLIQSLPRKYRNKTLLSGFIYLSGVLGIEMIGNLLVRTGDIKLHGISYGLFSTLEETLEMAGLIVFIHTLLIYIFDHQRQKLKIKFRLSSS